MNLLHFQRPSRYIGNEFNMLRKESDLSVCLCFPDIYEVGMSHLGLRVLYDIVNSLGYARAERAFHPWLDLNDAMRAGGEPLRSLETATPLREFDVLGFSLQYELSYTSVLGMLSLGGVPIKSAERDDSHPVVIAGGPCTVNPMPMAPFIDAFLVGDGEEALPEMLEAIRTAGGRRAEALAALSRIEGIYVPALHDGLEGHSVTRRFIASLEDAPFPTRPIVPYAEIVHDRVNIEVSRGCTMGCRFCQAGMIYRPLRERSPEKVMELATACLDATGYDEVAFTSLSAGDYSGLLKLLRMFNRKFSSRKLSVSLPSLRVRAVNEELLREVRAVRKSGFTVAPEAATERLRAVINKDFVEDDFDRAVSALFKEGWKNLKLYYMIGLPTERGEDLEAIPRMVKRAMRAARRHSGRHVNINVSVSPFVPKAHTPFQWYGQISLDEMQERKNYIRENLRNAKVKGHDVRMSMLEAAMARGGAEMAPLIEAAWRGGARLDGWTEAFNYEHWLDAMERTGADAHAAARREFGLDENLPWSVVRTGVGAKFMKDEYERAMSGGHTPDCRESCTACGLGCADLPPAATEGASGAQRPRLSIEAMRRPMSTPIKVRARFSKTGLLRLLSHRELMTAVTRAIRRAGIELEHTKGFNPSPKVAFGPPLGVGVAGQREYFDMEVLPGVPLRAMAERINAQLPGGIRIDELVSTPQSAPSLQAFLSRYLYEVDLGGKAEPAAAAAFMKRTEVLVVRKGNTIDIRPMVEAASVVAPGTVGLTLVDGPERKVRLDEVIIEMFGAPAADFAIRRTALYGYKDEWVEPLKENETWQVAS